MKILDKITLVLFSIIILIISILLVLLMFGWVNVYTITTMYSELQANAIASNVVLGTSVLCILLSLRAIFFGSSGSSNGKGEGILLENEAGKLLISRDTIENLVSTVAKGFENTQSVNAKVYITSENELKVYVTLMVLPNTVINELSQNLQTRIKEVVKQVADLEVKSIDIRIRDITTPEEKNEA